MWIIKALLTAIVALIIACFLLCLLIPRSRRYFFYTVRYLLKDNLQELLAVYIPTKDRKVPLWKFSSMAIIVSLIAFVLIVLICIIVPLPCIYRSIKDPESVESFINTEKGIPTPIPGIREMTPEEIEAERKAYQDMLYSMQFEVPREALGYVPSKKEIIFYSPEPVSGIEKDIHASLRQIKKLFKKKEGGYRFFFLPEVNRQLNGSEGKAMMEYYDPRPDKKSYDQPPALTYQDIKEALCIPERVDAPCLIRCKDLDDEHAVFSFRKIPFSEEENVLDSIKAYLRKVGDGCRYSTIPEKQLKHYLDTLPADERYKEDIMLIGKEIRERIEKLRSIGLTSMAIKKLIGDDSDKPGKLLIDKRNRLFLTDYGNKEIKLSPLHKAVYFLFLRHPEGIYFKDLGNYKEELASIYGEITGREDKKAVEDSISKLTDPFDNSINEKCARIKNAFVSEFREEVAQWYFIDGSKGEKKAIKLPRELVTWEIKD